MHVRICQSNQRWISKEW